jgi:hypothetical protein
MTRALHLLGCLAALTICGCGAETKDAFAERVRAACTRSESRVSPKTMELSALQAICGRTPQVSPLDDQTRQWLFEFPDGAVELPVLTDAGQSWDERNPRVFVLVNRIKVR